MLQEDNKPTTMVIVLDGSLEYVTQVRRKSDLVERKNKLEAAVDVNKFQIHFIRVHCILSYRIILYHALNPLTEYEIFEFQISKDLLEFSKKQSSKRIFSLKLVEGALSSCRLSSCSHVFFPPLLTLLSIFSVKRILLLCRKPVMCVQDLHFIQYAFK